MIQILILKSAGYVSAVAGDIGKLVTDDATPIGTLSSYDNTNRIWYITSVSTISANSVMAITTGTGAGTANADSTQSNVYCTKDAVKDRMLVLTSDTTYDTSFDNAIAEASALVDIFLKPYVTVPLSTYDSNITNLTADFAASIFKRRWMPSEVTVRGTLQPDMINDVDGTGWFALGLRKVEQYIKSYYVLAETLGNTAHNPDIFMSLFKQGLITGKEARNFINAVSTIANTVIDTITKTLDVTESQTLTKTQVIELQDEETIIKDITITQTETKVLKETITTNKNLSTTEEATKLLSDNETIDIDDTKRKYHTTKQKAFGFVSSDGNGGYQKDSEVE